MSSGEHPPPFWGKVPRTFRYPFWFPYMGTYFLAKLLKNGAKFIQKLTPDFKNHMRNLDNFRQAVESPKSWNSMGYICLKTTFLHLKYYLQIYLTLRSTTCLKTHQIPFVIFETINHFSRHSSSKLFLLKHYILLTKLSHQSANFQIFHCSSLKFIKSELFFKLWITVKCHER